MWKQWNYPAYALLHLVPGEADLGVKTEAIESEFTARKSSRDRMLNIANLQLFSFMQQSFSATPKAFCTILAPLEFLRRMLCGKIMKRRLLLPNGGLRLLLAREDVRFL
jgi:hypothetical protein